jgi:hypothetical protein
MRAPARSASPYQQCLQVLALIAIELIIVVQRRFGRGLYAGDRGP